MAVDPFMAANGRDRTGGGATPGGPAELLGALRRDGEQRVLPTLANALLVLALDPNLAGALCHDRFADRLLMAFPPPPSRDGEEPRPGPYPRPWRPDDGALFQAYMQRIWSHRFSRQTVEQAMETEAFRRGYHPIVDWLAGLRWDSKPRIDTWLRRAYGCPADPYHDAAGAKMLIASVRRVRRPGVKWDHTPVLEGQQEIGKSASLRALYGDAWFSDHLPNELAGKDAAMALNGVWCLELAELQQIIRCEPMTVTAFLTRQVDHYRPPYGKAYVDRPRQTVLVGTTNDEEWLSNPTGNRRYWPLACEWADPEWIAGVRDQLWAEAAAREAAGEIHWLDGATARTGAADAQSCRMIEDAWGDKVRGFLGGSVRATAADMLDKLNVPIAQQNKSSQMRVAAIMRAAGWRRERTTTSRYWVKPPKTAEVVIDGADMEAGGHMTTN